MTANEIRQKYMDFFKKLNHKEIPSAPLVPENDTSTLFTSAGMQPLINNILGEPHTSGYKRLVDSQKCFRTQDIMEVGDNRHTTFFEMLGNWSLGDYFKKEQLRWFFEFLTNNLGLDPSRLYVSVYEGNPQINVPRDEESILIWQELFKEKSVEAKLGERIFPYGDKKNWWSRSGEPSLMPIGEPGGPDSEVFFDFDPEGKYKFHENSPYKDKLCHPNCDCGRFLEIGNSVFMQYKKTKMGFEELSKKCVDFGGGLERITAAVNGAPDVFQTDLFLPIIQELESRLGVKYNSNEETTKSLRVIADHLKASVFLMADGVRPSNKLQGSVLRRLLRRSAAKAYLIKKDFGSHDFRELAHTIANIYPGYFKQVNYKNIEDDISLEIRKFRSTIEKGFKEIEKLSLNQLNALNAFNLYQSYGFPFEVSKELFEQKGGIVDRKEFDEAYKGHQELSRETAAKLFKGGLQDSSVEVTRLHTATHLLHKALHIVLGESVSQKGSNITKERLRFDFSSGEKMTEEQIKKVEQIVNEQIKNELPVEMKIETLDAAKAEGAYAFFGEKYGEKVKVYSVGNWSKEVCGGPHVTNTKELGRFSIIKEESAGSDVRRIYAKLE